MLVGAAFNMGATLSFAYLRNYYLLIIARAMQALAGSLSVVGGTTVNPNLEFIIYWIRVSHSVAKSCMTLKFLSK